MESNWIPVTERLPDFKEFVLITLPGRALPSQTVAFLTDLDETKNTWMTCSFSFFKSWEVSHWMPLPALPERL